jgi:hypothetical protein
MYEIWLGLNIVYETLLPGLLWWLLLALAWITLLVAAWRTPQANWRRAWPATLILGAFAALVAFVLLPALTASSLSELKYWVDWVFLGSLALGAGAMAMALGWPALAWLARRA